MFCFFLVGISKALIELSATNEVWPGAICCLWDVHACAIVVTSGDTGQSPDDRLRAGHQQFVKLCKQHKIRFLAA